MKKQVFYDMNFKDAKAITQSFIAIDIKLQSMLDIWSKILRQNDCKDPTNNKKRGVKNG